MKQTFSRRALLADQGRLSYFVLAIIGASGLASIAYGAVGDLYEADFGSGNIFRFTPAGARTTFAVGLGNPAGLAFDHEGNLFVANNNGNSIIKITPAGAKTTFAVALSQPFGLAFDMNGNLYEADEGSGSVFKFTATGAKSMFATGLSSPAGLAFDGSGNLFVSNFTAGRIDKIAPNGTRTTFATGLSFPDGLYFSSSGDLLECDSGSGKVFSFTLTGTKTTFATGFVQNSGVITDAAGNAYVAQNAAGTITKITPNRLRTTFAAGLFNPQYLAFEPAIPMSTATLGNISTRAFVQTGNNVMIGGFIVQGTTPKRVIIRAIGPELIRFGVPDPLADPKLELHNGAGALIASNDNWEHTIIGGIITSDQVSDIMNSGHAPDDPRESAIVAELPAGNYTAIIRGVSNSIGVALVEVYDLSSNTPSILGNISTRAFVLTGNNVMIGGFIVQGTGSKRVIVRAIGPELSRFGVPGPMADPRLQLHDRTGALIASNDNWEHTIIGGIITSDQVSDIMNSGHAPDDPRESAIIAELPAGDYTAIVQGVNNTTGVALVEVYDLH